MVIVGSGLVELWAAATAVMSVAAYRGVLERVPDHTAAQRRLQALTGGG